MKYLSICSGIEAASVAWEPLGWKPVGFAEIEKFPSAVLAHHWPDVPNLGDMTQHHEWPTTLQPDLIVGGCPCQAFSVAGLREGLNDPRGNLTLTFLSIIEQYRPRWVVYENVPGILSDKTGAFGSLLGGLGELGYGFAYRVLDAQYFGVAQRRRRVFVVACLGDWQRAAAVLFESHSLQRHTPPSREARKGTATGFETGPCGNRFIDTAPTLDTKCKDGPIRNQIGAGVMQFSNGNGGGQVAIATSSVMFERRFVRTSGGQPQEELSHCLRADQNTGDGAPCVAFAQNQRDEIRTMEVAGALAAEPGMKQQTFLAHNHIVRRLTPTECEFLQGFPRNHTLIPVNGKPAADGPRYKALGNSMAVPVMRWIGERIQMMNDL